MHLGSLVLIFSAALLAPVVAYVTRGFVPVPVGQILLGVVLGVTGLAILEPERADLTLLYTLGFATLMFTVGMHVPLHDRRLRPALPQGLRATGLTLPLAAAAGWVIHLLAGGPAGVYAVIVGSCSAAVALPLIDERAGDNADLLPAIVWIIAADIVAMVLVPLALKPSTALSAVIGVTVVVGLGAAIFAVARYASRQQWIQAMRREGKHRGWALDLRAAVLILVALSFIAEKAGTSLLIAGFATGLVVGAMGGPKRLSREVLGLGQGFLIPIFFVLLGARVDLRALADSPGAIGLTCALIAATALVHMIVNASLRTPTAIAVVAGAQIGVPSAVIALGLSEGTLGQAEASAILCAAMASLLLAGWAARWLTADGDQAASHLNPNH